MHDRVAGWTILLAALLSLVVMLHHPTIHNADSSHLMAELRVISAIDRVMHGAMIVLMTAFFFGFAVFSMRLGLDRTSPLIALIAFTISTIALMAAALIDGFLIPDVAQRFGGAGQGAADIGNALVAGGAMAIGELTRFAIVAASGAICCWSLALLSPRYRRLPRITGALGAVAALYAVVALASTHHLGPHAVLRVAAAQYAWYLLAGAMLVRGELSVGNGGRDST